MFKWDELDGLKESAFNRSDWELVVIYQNEQILRELKSIGWKLKEINDRGIL